LLLVILGIHLIFGGAYPSDGNGSLGHAGMIIAGTIASFLAIVFGLFSIFFIGKSRAINRGKSVDTQI
jgi:hypothetical protein